MRRIFMACLALAPALAAGALAACGGSDSNEFTAEDGGADAAADGTVSDSAGGDSAASDTGSGVDTGPSADSGRDAGCAVLAKKACEDCCAAAHPAGARAFREALLSCGCQPQLCGPTDAGSDAADAGVLGSGACTQTCEAPDSGVSETCANCINATVAKDGGACYTSVSNACATNQGCVAYFACLAGCH